MLGVFAAFAADPAPPPEPELFGREPKLQLSHAALVFDQGITLRVPEAEFEGLFLGADGKPLARLRPTADTFAPKIRAESLKLWIGRQFVPVEVLATKPSAMRGDFEVGIFQPLAADLKADAYSASEAKDAVGSEKSNAGGIAEGR